MTSIDPTLDPGISPRPSAFGKLIQGCFIVVVLLILLSGGAAYWGYNQYQTELKSAAGIDATLTPFEITLGQPVRSIAIALEGEGFIRDALWFRIAAKIQHKDVGISFGTHQLSSSMTLQQVIDALQGPGKKLGDELLIAPGLRLDEVADLLQAFKISQSSFDQAKLAASYDYYWLSQELPYDVPTGVTLEGFLYPDTYEIPKDATASAVVIRALNNFQNRFEEAGINELLTNSSLSLYDALILASIVQKEAGGFEDMQHVAGVFLNRLDQGMSLGSDVTVLYALGDWKAELNAGTLNINSPYNTRRFEGLPPGPIGSPTIAALEAVLRPTPSDDLYFIADRNSIIRYAKTYGEHQTNIRTYGLAGDPL